MSTFQFPVYSKNLLSNQPYQITFDGETVYMYKVPNSFTKLQDGTRNLKYILRTKLSTTVGWMPGGFIVHIGNKQKKYYTDDIATLGKFKELLACKVSYYNVFEFYDFREQIGKGAFSRVVKAQHKASQRWVAIKIIDKCTLTPLNYVYNKSIQASLESEVQILLKVRDSVYCSQILEIYQSQYAYYVVLNLLDGQPLSHYLDKEQRLTTKQTLQIMRRLLEGINYLHSVGVIHRDIKPDNLVMKEKDNFDTLTIVDFGLSTTSNVNRYLFYKCGTPGYVAPEILNSMLRNQQSESCDIFSCGCIFYRLITGRCVFKGKNYEELLLKNKQCQIDYNVHYDKHYNDSAIKLLHSMLRMCPKERISAKAALQSSYFYNESLFSINDENWDSTPLVNQMPLFQAVVGKVFENSTVSSRDYASTRLIIPKQMSNFYSPQVSPTRRN